MKKKLNCGAATSSEPHRNVFADLHKKKKRYASGLLIDRSGSSSVFFIDDNLYETIFFDNL